MRLNLGIRRRLAPLLDNDRRRIEVANSILFTLPGAPIVYYGDEIGMGDNIWLFDRNGVRTPMQWTAQPGTGFSTAEPWVPILDDDIYGYQKVNVAAQVDDPDSLLSTMKHFIKVRKENPVLGNGTCDFLPLNNKAVLTYLRHTESAAILAVHNLSDQLQTTRFDLSDYAGRVPVDILDRAVQPFQEISTVPYQMNLAPFDYFWLRLA